MSTLTNLAFSDTVRSTLHFGIDAAHNLQSHWRGIRLLWRKYFNEEFHTFGLEWDEHGIWTWENTRNYRVLNKKFHNFAIDRQPIQRDDKGAIIPPPNPWLTANNKAAPFDQCKYNVDKQIHWSKQLTLSLFLQTST